MTRYFMRDTPLYQMEQMMMTPPNFRPRGHGLHPSRFHYYDDLAKNAEWVAWAKRRLLLCITILKIRYFLKI